jgi:hypothetical protein
MHTVENTGSVPQILAKTPKGVGGHIFWTQYQEGYTNLCFIVFIIKFLKVGLFHTPCVYL